MTDHPNTRSTTAFDALRTYLHDKGAFTEEQFAFMAQLFVAKRLAAADVLQRAGDPASYMVFVAAGCLRRYVIDARGTEHVVQFAPENWWMSDGVSYLTGAPAQYFVDAIETSELLLIDAASHQRLVDRVPPYAAAFRAGLVRSVAARDQRIVSVLSGSAEERYLEFLNTYPSISRRVPQSMLASYLGMTPETLSRVRKKLSRK